MKYITRTNLPTEYVKLVGKPALLVGDVYLTADIDESLVVEDKIVCAPFLDTAKFDLATEGGLIFCDTEEEVFELFYQVVGDDGPTLKNPYKGSWRMYAAVIDSEGNYVTENT